MGHKHKWVLSPKRPGLTPKMARDIELKRKIADTEFLSSRCTA